MTDGAIHEVDAARELDRIAERVAALVRALQALRDENHTLRVTLDQREGENQVLRERLDSVRARVEGLIARIPPMDAPSDPAAGRAADF